MYFTDELPAPQGRAGPVRVAFTDGRPDLSESAPDRSGRFAVLAAEIGVPISRTRQVHGSVVHEVTAPAGQDETPPEADAQLTRVRGVALLTRAADCVPVVMADAGAGVIAAVHAGRNGTMLDIAGAATERMREAGAEDITAWIGPHVCGSCYEVPGAMQAQVSARVPEAASTTRWGTPGLDLGAAVEASLRGAGVGVRRVAGCTLEEADLPSHRRDATPVRLGGLIWMAP